MLLFLLFYFRMSDRSRLKYDVDEAYKLQIRAGIKVCLQLIFLQKKLRIEHVDRVLLNSPV